MTAANRLLIISRLVCAIALIALVTTDPLDSGFQVEFDDLFAVVFGLWAIATAVVSIRSWFLDYISSRALIGTDIAAFVVFTAWSAAVHETTIAAAYCLPIHIVFSSVLRWQTSPIHATVVTVVANAFWTIDILAVELRANTIDLGGAARSVLFAYLVSGLFFMIAKQLIRPLPSRFRIADPGPGMPLAVASFDYIRRVTGATEITLLHSDRFSGTFTVIESPSSGEVNSGESLDFVVSGSVKQLKPMIFDLVRKRALVFADSSFSVRAEKNAPDLRVFRHLGKEVGICVPIETSEGTDWLILSGISMLGWGNLQQSYFVAKEVGRELEARITATLARDAALSRLRETIARDLHDSVAHSLAGAKYLLMGLRSKVASNTAAVAEIDRIRAALEAEHLNVRELITHLRETDPATGMRNFIEDLESILPILAARWETEIKIAKSDFRLLMPSSQSLELQQIVREAVSNAARHGHADAITIQCKSTASQVNLVIHDNGVGFEPAAPKSPRSISERVNALQGSMELESCPGSTTLDMTFPKVHPLRENW